MGVEQKVTEGTESVRRCAGSSFGFRHSFVIGCFVIRHWSAGHWSAADSSLGVSSFVIRPRVFRQRSADLGEIFSNSSAVMNWRAP